MLLYQYSMAILCHQRSTPTNLTGYHFMATTFSRLRLRQTDEKLRPWRALPKSRPARGWVRAIREALGLTTVQLAQRLGVTRQSVVDLERREMEGSVTIAALTRAAHALDCDLVYAIVPRRSLSDMVAQQARRRAEEKVRKIAHTMRLEAQEVSPEEIEHLITESAAAMLHGNVRRLWD